MAVIHGTNIEVNKVPSLDLRFSDRKDLVDTISGENLINFSRSSTGTYVGSDGLIKTAASNEARFDHDPATGESLGLLVEEARTNQSQYSEYFDNTYWTKSGIVTPNSAVFIDDKITASSLVASGSETDVRKNFALSVNTYYAFSVYAKKNSSKYCYLYALGHPFAYFVAVFDLDTGICTQQDTRNNNYYPLSTNYAINGVDVGNGYYRLTIISNTPTYASQTYGFGIAPQGTGNTLQGGGIPITGTVAGDSIYVGGAQLETGSFPTSYIPTPATFTSRSTTATYYDANGVIQTAGSNVARSNAYFPDANGVMRPAGLLLEAASTNYVYFSSCSTVINSQEITLATVTGLPGAFSTAQRLTSSGGNDRRVTYASNSSGVAITLSVYARLGTQGSRFFIRNGTGPYITFNLSTVSVGNNTLGTEPSIQNVGNGWYRCSVKFTDNGQNFLIGPASDTNLNSNAGDNIIITGLQAENSSYPTSYIPTSGSTVTRAADVSSSSTVTRSADVVQITGSNFSSWYNQSGGTLVTNSRVYPLPLNYTQRPYCAVIMNSNGSQYWGQTWENCGEGNVRVDTTAGAQASNTGLNLQTNQIYNVTYKSALGIEFSGDVNVNGIGRHSHQGLTATNVSVPKNTAFVDRLTFGTQINGNGQTGIWQGHLSRLTYYPQRLQDSTLQKLTE